MVWTGDNLEILRGLNSACVDLIYRDPALQLRPKIRRARWQCYRFRNMKDQDKSKRTWGRIVEAMKPRNANQCLVVLGCVHPTIGGHSIPRNLQKGLANNDGDVMMMVMSYDADTQEPAAKMLKRGIGLASVGGFSCKLHDQDFNPVDMTFDKNSHKDMSLLFARAIMYEIWCTENTISNTKAMSNGEALIQMRRLPEQRQALYHARKLALDCLASTPDSSNHDCEVVHHYKFIKSEQATMAASAAGARYDRFYDDIGRRLSKEEAGAEPNTAWTMSVFPVDGGHAVALSRIRGSLSERFQQHIIQANGKSLQEAVSAELILFSENWVVNPETWDKYGHKRQVAITEAFNNFPELFEEKYTFTESGPWWEQCAIPNRHQINLFKC